jgi:hypothetical protein
MGVVSCNFMRKNFSAIIGTDVTVQEDAADWRLRTGAGACPDSSGPHEVSP